MFTTLSLSEFDRQGMVFLLETLSPFAFLAMIGGTICTLSGLLPLAVYLPFDVLTIFALRWVYRNGGFRW